MQHQRPCLCDCGPYSRDRKWKSRESQAECHRKLSNGTGLAQDGDSAATGEFNIT